MLERAKYKWLHTVLSGSLVLSPVFPLITPIQVHATENIPQGTIVITKYSNTEIWGEFQTTAKRDNIIAVLTLPNGKKKHYSTPFMNSTTGVFKFVFPDQPNGTKVELMGLTVGEGRYNLTEVVSVVLDKNEVKAPATPVANPVFSGSTEVMGYARPGVTVSITNGEDKNQVTASENGAFTFKLDQPISAESIILSASDAIGTSPDKTINIQTQEAILPLEVTPINENISSFTINTLPNTYVEIRKNNEVFQTISPSENTTGERYVGNLMLDHDDEVLVQAYDDQGHYSVPVIQKVQDVTDPYLSNLQRVTDAEGKVSILSEPGVRIEIKKDDQLIVEGMTNELGMFHYTFQEKPEGAYRTTAYDAAGNTSVIDLNVMDVTPPEPPVINGRIFMETVEITGTAEPRATIDMYKNGQYYKTAYVDLNGNFLFTSYEWNEGDYIQFYAIDQNKNKSTSLDQVIQISPVPSQPVVSDFTNASVKLTGTTDPEATVICYRAGVKIAEGKADETGKFEIKDVYEKEGTELTIVSTYLGKSSLPTNITVRDAVAPSMPVVQDITDKDTVVTGTAEANAEVQILVNEVVIGKGISLADGTFSIPIPMQKAKTSLYIVVIDYSGNKSIPLNKVVLDKTAPVLLHIDPVSDQSTAITGKTEPFAIVRIGKPGQLGADVVSNEQGNFTYSMMKQPANTVFELTVRDVAGNLSNVYRVTVLDKTAPILSKVNSVSNLSTTVTGTVEPYAMVKVKGKDGKIYEAKATGTGSFSVPIVKQPARIILEVTARDSSGNVSDIKKVTVLDKIAPGAPTVSTVTNLSTAVTGKAEPRSLVQVKAGSTLIGYGYANAYGYFSIKITPRNAGTYLIVTATDASKNVSKLRVIRVVSR